LPDPIKDFSFTSRIFCGPNAGEKVSGLMRDFFRALSGQWRINCQEFFRHLAKTQKYDHTDIPVVIG
jgi:hypothetical protein